MTIEEDDLPEEYDPHKGIFSTNYVVTEYFDLCQVCRGILLQTLRDCVLLFVRDWEDFTRRKLLGEIDKADIIAAEKAKIEEWVNTPEFTDICDAAELPDNFMRKILLTTLRTESQARRIAHNLGMRTVRFKNVLVAMTVFLCLVFITPSIARDSATVIELLCAQRVTTTFMEHGHQKTHHYIEYTYRLSDGTTVSLPYKVNGISDKADKSKHPFKAKLVVFTKWFQRMEPVISFLGSTAQIISAVTGR